MSSRPIHLRVASSHPPGNPGHLSTTFVIDESLAVDAGAIASRLSLDEQKALRHVLVTHAHLDHVHELPQFLDNVQTARDPDTPPRPLDIHGEDSTLQMLGTHVFGGLWPDVVDPAVGFAALRGFSMAESPRLSLAGFDVLPFRTVHRLPAVGFLFRRAGVSLAIIADTGLEKDLLEPLSREKELRFLAIEVSYPNRLDDEARAHGHLTARQLATALEPVLERHREIRVLVHHLKPAFAGEVLEEIGELSVPATSPRVARDGDRFRIP